MDSSVNNVTEDLVASTTTLNNFHGQPSIFENQDLLFFDTETCGFHGLAVLIQYAVGNGGEIILFEPWRRPVKDTITLIEWMVTKVWVGFNLAFDAFHINKLYTTWLQYLKNGGSPEDIPYHNVEAMAIAEEQSRFLNICVKPKSALDLMLHARKGPYQSLMSRDDIRVRRVPEIMAERLRGELENRVQLDGIYFKKRKNQYAPRWGIYDSVDKDGNTDPEFKDIVLKFNPEAGLKALAEHVLGVKSENILTMSDVEVDSTFYPEEVGYAPFAKAIGRPGRWNGAWPEVIDRHILHWAFNKRARKYATDDIVYTRGLFQHSSFAGAVIGDDDSILATMVGALRWHGYNVDLERITKQRSEAILRAAKAPTAPSAVMRWLGEVMDSDEVQILTSRGTADVVLQEIGGTIEEEKCECKGNNQECPKCGGQGTIEKYVDYWETEEGDPHPAAERAREVRKARAAKKEIELYDKLIQAKRFHASFVVIGALSSRMAGSDGLNPQGIISSKYVRECFLLADDGEQLDGGDFASFEVCISAAVYKDQGLENDIKSGKKIHALFAEALFPDQTYDSIMASKGSKTGRDFYSDGKRGVFGLNYGGNADTLVKRLGIVKETAEQAFARFEKRYPGVKRARERIISMFCSMRQPGGIGTQVVWHEPADKIESLLGFPRYFTLENQICKALYDLAQNPPKEWKEVRVKVVRRDRTQTAAGACQSALYGAAFGLQGACMRAASNHVIQSTGAGITKAVQRAIWDLQPVGVLEFKIRPMNIHDEIMVPCIEEMSAAITETVKQKVEEYRPVIPLIEIDWGTKLKSWASK